MKKVKIKKKLKDAVKYSFAIAVIAVFLFPVVYMIACSFFSGNQIGKLLDFNNGEYKKIELIPEMFSFNQYYQVFFRSPEYLSKLWNSLIITVPTVVVQVIVSSLAAFAFAKLNFPFRDKLFFVYIILLLLPVQVTLVPNYMIFNKIKLLNSFLSVILPGAFSAFGICLLRQSIKYISNSSIEAARIDGASYFKIFTNIIIPQIKGGLITLTLLCFIDSWNNVEQPIVYLSDNAKFPLSVGLSGLNTTNYNTVFACGVMFMIPPLLIYLYGHNDISSPFVSVDK